MDTERAGGSCSNPGAGDGVAPFTHPFHVHASVLLPSESKRRTGRCADCCFFSHPIGRWHGWMNKHSSDAEKEGGQHGLRL